MLSLTSLFFTFGGYFGPIAGSDADFAALAATSASAVPDDFSDTPAVGHPAPIVIVGTEATARKLREILLGENFGFAPERVVTEPVIGLNAVTDTADLDDALHTADAFDWLLFFSRPACEFFARRADELGVGDALRRGPKVATVGEATADAARAAGFSPTVTADTGTAANLVDILVARNDVKQTRLLVPRSAAGEDAVLEPLRQVARAVRTVATYDNCALPIAEPLWRARTAPGISPILAFLSSSAVTALWSGLPMAVQSRLAECAKMLALGPSTADTLRQVRWPVTATATPSTLAALAQEIRAHSA